MVIHWFERPLFRAILLSIFVIVLLPRTTFAQLVENGWVNTGSTLPGSLDHAALEVMNGNIYLFGGNCGSGYNCWLNTIYRAPVSNPTFWTNTGSTLPTGLAGSASAVIGDYVYLFGGSVGAPNLSSAIYRAPVSNPTSWSLVGNLPMGLCYSQLEITGDYVYLFGGFKNTAPSTGVDTNTILRAPVSNPTSWTNTGRVLPGPLSRSPHAIIGNYVYLFGGSCSSGQGCVTNAIYRAPLADPLSWSSAGTLPTLLIESQVAVIGNYVYLFGGISGSLTNAIDRAPVTDPLTWSAAGGVLPTAVARMQIATTTDAVYLFGGVEAGVGTTNKIYRAPIIPPDPCPIAIESYWGSGTYLLWSGATRRINFSGQNYCISNSSGYNYFVPGKTAAEINSFTNAIPRLSGLTRF